MIYTPVFFKCLTKTCLESNCNASVLNEGAPACFNLFNASVLAGEEGVLLLASWLLCTDPQFTAHVLFSYLFTFFNYLYDFDCFIITGNDRRITSKEL